MYQRPQSERRSSGRFPIHEELRYRIIEGSQQSDPRVGKTLNISSAGLLFTTSETVRAGKRLEVSMNWPARLDGTCRLKLVVMGRVVRCESGQTAMSIEQYEFKTQGHNGLAAAAGATA